MTVPSLREFGYDEIEVVGAGGLGDVYRARRVSTGGFVAIKVVREQVDRDATERRVRRELEALLKLKGHPNVVQIEELVALPTGLALVMEYVSGGSLMDVLRESGPLDPARAVAAMSDTARAITDAHALGIVHRDIKPHNVMVGQFGQCKVCDFGIAAMFKESSFTDRTSALSYRYASPEELDDAAVIGPETDVYSLGVTLRQLLTGETSGARAAAVLSEQERAVSSPAQAGVRRSLVELIAMMTNRNPGDRPHASAVLTYVRELERALGAERVDSVLRSNGSSVPAASPSPPPPPPPAASPPPPPPSQADEPADDRTVVRPSRPPAPPSTSKVLPSPNDAPERWWA